MFSSFKNAVGLTDKHHGAAALHSVKTQTVDTQYTILKKEDEAWEILEGTNVECKTFYFVTDSGKIALVQFGYSNLLNVKRSVQLGVKVFSEDATKPHLWESDLLSGFTFPNNKLDMKAQNCSLTLSEDGKTYKINSDVKSKVNIAITQQAPSFVVGKDGYTVFGLDPNKPNGRMKHAFWPRCTVEGVIITKEGSIDVKGKGMFVHVLQGLKPHFAASKWNFAHFQSPTYSAISMEFTTPPSYDSQTVSVGCVAVDGKLLIANADSTATHVRTVEDKDAGLAEPKETKYTWSGKSDEGQALSAEINAVFPEQRMDRIDIMDEIPKVLKGLVSGATGVKPFIYQNGPHAKIVINNGGQVTEEEGRLFCEATFVAS